MCLAMTTIFTRIINGEIPGTFVHRDDRCVVFMSINPMARGHALVVPIEEVDHWIDCSPSSPRTCSPCSQRIGRAQQRAFDCDRVGLIIAGYEVPHAHIHLIPTVEHGPADLRQRGGVGRPRRPRGGRPAIRDALAG